MRLVTAYDCVRHRGDEFACVRGLVPQNKCEECFTGIMSTAAGGHFEKRAQCATNNARKLKVPQE